MNVLFLALLAGGLLYFLWQWDNASRRRRAVQKRPGARPSAVPRPAKIPLSLWLARIAVGAIAAWMVFLVITLFRSAT